MALQRFHVVTGPIVERVLSRNRHETIDWIREAYLLHHDGRTVVPESVFLRLPDSAGSRIIGLPAYRMDSNAAAGIKWVSSFPSNLSAGLPRASALMVLNDPETGYPLGCLEASRINAARTAASAALAAQELGYSTQAAGGPVIGVVGAGVIARSICEALALASIDPSSFLVHDLDHASAEALCAFLGEGLGLPARPSADLDEAINADIVVLATTAGEPYINRRFRPGQLVLNISLRDIGPDSILAASNIVDDVDHCLRERTSPHLTEQAAGNRNFIMGTLAQVLRGEIAVPHDRPIVFSPFGLGILDLVVATRIFAQALEAGEAIEIPDFYAGAGHRREMTA